MEERFDRLETMLVALREEMSAGFAAVGRRFVGMEERVAAGDEDTRSLLKTEIDSLRNDIRIFAEAHLTLEKRVTALERRPR